MPTMFHQVYAKVWYVEGVTYLPPNSKEKQIDSEFLKFLLKL